MYLIKKFFLLRLKNYFKLNLSILLLTTNEIIIQLILGEESVTQRSKVTLKR